MTIYICTPGLKALKIDATCEQEAAAEYFRRLPLTNGMIQTLFVYPETADRRLEKDGYITRIDDLDVLVSKGLCTFFPVGKCIELSGLPTDAEDYANN